MSIISQQVKTIAFAAALSAGLSRVGVAQSASGGSIEKAAETKGSAHPAHAAWIPGFWDLEGDPATAPRGGWVWVPGHWEAPPVPGAQWDDSHWGWSSGWWSWIPGHWDESQRAG